VESIDKGVLIVIGVVVLWLIIEPVLGLLGLFVKAGRKRND
jgi:hypothetical protein